MAVSGKMPVVYQSDVIIAGGSLAAVAAAVSAARAGRRVFLASPENYLGEDLCATGRLWLPKGTSFLPQTSDSAPLRPMEIKRRLDDELIAANVEFLYGCAPADLLVDSAGAVAGVVFACRSGLFAVTGRMAVDATLNAVLAHLAEVPFTQWSGGDVRFKRVVMGHRAQGDAGNIGISLPGPVRGEVWGDVLEADAFEYALTLHVKDLSPAAWAEAEQVIIDRTWHKDQTWSFDRPWHVPPIALDNGNLHNGDDAGAVPMAAMSAPRPGLFVLGPCAAFTRSGAEAFMEAPASVALGEALGAHVAELAGKTDKNSGRVRPLKSKPSDPGILEPCTCDRFWRHKLRTLTGAAGADLPVFGEYDVVVAGGGTGGAPAAIAAARAGARVLVLESLAALGGVGTIGCVSAYYHANVRLA